MLQRYIFFLHVGIAPQKRINLLGYTFGIPKFLRTFARFLFFIFHLLDEKDSFFLDFYFRVHARCQGKLS
jgi:hypothetical protein